uniref:Uncharacterized protein n=1 Tax=Setaria viridis TaxID=4556 RepID=A0A4U6VEB3_SETVI|nr:hypothetical protein SEVIR_3G207100v2 [Setaria viridis]
MPDSGGEGHEREVVEQRSGEEESAGGGSGRENNGRRSGNGGGEWFQYSRASRCSTAPILRNDINRQTEDGRVRSGRHITQVQNGDMMEIDSEGRMGIPSSSTEKRRRCCHELAGHKNGSEKKMWRCITVRKSMFEGPPLEIDSDVKAGH